MNEVIQTMMNHRSCRQYSDKPVPDDHLQAILHAAQWGPSWIHGQQVSVIVIREPNERELFAELVGGQAHVAQAPIFLVFCADFHRAAVAAEARGKFLAALEDVDALMVGATDVGIALSNAITAAESLGLGTVPIGGIRRQPLRVIETLQLPSYVIPISGLCIGYPEETVEQKPRLPLDVFTHDGRYEPLSQKTLATYDELISGNTKQRTGGATTTTWSDRLISFYEQPYYQEIAAMLKQQGFTCKNVKEEG
ncbi:NADPH-dependent oxidoreductase [Halalkalibacterium halodurans]|uniref:NADPH-dependent oxidoreductase n=1 Tax=Halalkalibacterium halodurans TaxID=86665 RepID=UPI002E23A6D0|nr:NADPH-dependent oxidoreductase [Halalkalibacterium halodurans]